MTSAIEIQDLAVSYSKKLVLGGVSLSVQKGEVFGFVGPNGAGKTTAIKTILGLIPVYKGKVFLNGLPPSDPRSRSKVGFLPEEANYYRFLTPVETLVFYGRIFQVPRRVLKERIEKLLSLVGLTGVRDKLIGTFSKGMIQKVGLAQSLINEPEILILDEPTSGLDPLARMDLRKVLSGLKGEGKTIFFSSHELSEVELLCDSIALLKEGRLVRSGLLGEVLGPHREKSLERFFLETIQRP